MSKRSSIVILVTLMILIGFVAIFAYINQEKLIDRFVENRANNSWRLELLEDTESLTLITIGTSSLLPSERAQTCNIVIANGEVLVFDLGQGSFSNIENLRIPFLKSTQIFISNWHSDHFIDLPAFINRGWLLGRKGKITISGPKGLDKIVDGIDSMLRTESQMRSQTHGTDHMDLTYMDIGKNVIESSTKQKMVYQNGELTVSAINVGLATQMPTLAYKIEYKGKSIVISGDTPYDENMISFAAGADILLYGAMEKDLVERASRLQIESGNNRNATLLKNIIPRYSSPQDAARIAEKSSAKKLILTSLAPPPENPISRRVFKLGLDDIYQGPVLLAEDGDIFKIE